MKRLLILLFLGGFSANFASAKSCLYVTQSVSDSLEFTDYYGTYILQEIKLVERFAISFKNGNLIAQAKGYPSVNLIRKKEDEFEEQRFGITITFLRENYQVTGIKANIQNKEIIAVKE